MIDVISQQGTAADLTETPLHDCRSYDSPLRDCYLPPLGGDCRSAPLAVAVADGGPLERLRPANIHTLPLSDEYAAAYVPSFSSIVVLNRAARDLLQRLPCDPQVLSAEERDALRRLQRLRLVRADDALPPPPEPTTLAVWLHISNACNLRCSYCYLQKSQEAMSPPIVRAAVDTAIRSARQHGYSGLALNYAGGEASLRMDLVELAHTYAQQQAARASVQLQAGLLSNGTNLTPATLEAIRRLGLRLMISLDGLGQEHNSSRPTIGGQGSLDRILAGIAHAQSAGISPDIAITVSATNIDHLTSLLRWLLARNLRFSLSFYREHDANAAHTDLRIDQERLIAGMRRVYAEIARNPPPWSLTAALLDRADLTQPHARSCAAGHHYLVIDQQGRIASCQMQLDQPLSSVHASDPLHTIRHDLRAVRSVPVDEKEGCRHCEWRYWCGGGCPLATFRATGRYDTGSPHCAIYQSLYPELIRLEGLRLLHWHRRAADSAAIVAAG
ncbi:MAG: radical SAM protein [Oscillochloris sp.]|nr:radical SAM protein [Oscillochloris sp.]